MGKLIQMELEADSEAKAMATEAIQHLLANPVMERGEILFVRAL